MIYKNKVNVKLRPRQLYLLVYIRINFKSLMKHEVYNIYTQESHHVGTSDECQEYIANYGGGWAALSTRPVSLTEKEIEELAGTSSVIGNLLKDKTYRPYCGNTISRTKDGGCHNPRTIFTGLQFRCPNCGWVSQFPEDFIKTYRRHHGL